MRVACSCCGRAATNHVAGYFSCAGCRPASGGEPFVESATGFDWFAALAGRVAPWVDPFEAMPAWDDPNLADALADQMAELAAT